ncbi:MAG: NUDIX hydrolase, partial [Verrucomicrobia bacterium]|nr:NUDIX hydrolase [Verrucomicrobiota bacterium]
MNKPYSVSVRITEPQGNILWVRRSASAPKRAGQYEYPGGHVEPGERAREAALREVREEVGLKIPEYELRVLKRVEQEKGDHIIFEYRARKAFYPKLSLEHDHFIWSPTRPAPALRRAKPKRIIRARRNPADLLRENGLFSYLKGKDTSGMTTEEKARQAAVGTGTTLAVKGASRALSKKLAAKTGAKVASKGASKFVPFVGQAIMVVDAAPEAVAVAKESRVHKKRTSQEVRSAEGFTAKVKAYGKGKARETAHAVGGIGRIGAAAFVGSDVVKMGREAATEKLMAKQNGAGTFMFRRGGKAISKIGAKVAAKGGITSLAKGATIGVLAVTGLAKTAAREGMEVKEIIQGKRKNPSDIQANVAEINKLLKTMPSAWKRQLDSNRVKLMAAGAGADQVPPERPNAHN